VAPNGPTGPPPPPRQYMKRQREREGAQASATWGVRPATAAGVTSDTRGCPQWLAVHRRRGSKPGSTDAAPAGPPQPPRLLARDGRPVSPPVGGQRGDPPPCKAPPAVAAATTTVSGCERLVAGRDTPLVAHRFRRRPPSEPLLVVARLSRQTGHDQLRLAAAAKPCCLLPNT